MEIFAERAPWFVAGPLIGLLVVAGYWAVNAPLGGVGAWAAAADRVAGWSRGWTWRSAFLGGLVLGGVVFALLSGRDTGAVGAFAAPWALAGGGLLMGLGARWAGGCTLGHGMCGTSAGSPASFASTATFMATAIGVAHLLTAVAR